MTKSPLLLRVTLAAFAAGMVITSAQAQTVQTQSPAALERAKPILPKPTPTPTPKPGGGDPDGTWTSTANGNWSDTTKWAGGIIADLGGKADFSTVNLANNRTVTIDTASRTVREIDIGDTDGTNHFTITGGNLIFDNTANSADAILNETATASGDIITAPVALNSSLDISNASAGTLTISTGGITAGTAGTKTITTSTGPVAISGIIGDGSGAVAVVQNGSGTLTLTGVNTFSGGVTVKAGTVSGSTSASAFGTGTITLGDAAVSSNATLLGSALTFTNPITVASVSSGTLTIGNSGNSSAVFSGAVTLNNNLTLTGSGTGSVKLSGGVTGTGNITLNITGAGNTTFFDTNPVNNVGTITNSGAGNGAATITSTLGGNVTQLIQNSSNSSLTLSATSNTTFVGSVAVNAGTLFMGKASALNAANVVSVASGATFDINNLSETIAGLNTGTGTVTNSGAAAKTLTLGGNGNYSFGGNITATTPANMALAIALTSAGSQTLSGASNYAGGTTISSGTLNINSSTAIGTGTLSVAGATIGNTSGNAITLTNSNNINITAGTLTFSGPNDLSFGNNTVTMTGGNRSISVSGGDNLTIGGIAEDTPPRNFTKSGNGNLILIGASTYTGTTTISNNGALQLGNGGTTGSLSTSSTITDNAILAFNRTNSVVQGTDFSGSAVGGTGAIIQLGTGSLTLNAANGYQAGTTLSAGTLNINNSSAIGTGRLTISAVSTIDNTSGNAITLSTNNAQAWNSNFTFLGSSDLNFGTGLITLNGSQTVTAGAGTLTEGGTVDVDPTNTSTRTLTFNGAGNVTLNGTVQNSFAGSTGNLTYSGTGTLTLNGTNTYNGITTLSSGTVAIGNDSAFGTSALAIGGGTLSAVGGPHSISNTTTLVAGNGTIAGANDLTFTGSFTESGGDRTLTINNTGTTTLNALNLSGNNTGRNLTVTGTGNVVLNGTTADGGTGAGSLTFDSGYAGTATINGANTYSGGTTLTAGTFVLGNKSAFGTGTVALGGISASASTDLSGANAIANSGTLKNTNTFTGTNNIEFSGTFTNIDTSGVIKNSISGGTLTLSGTLNLSNNTNSRTLSFSGNGNTLVSGGIQNGSATPVHLVRNSGGTLTVTHVDTYTGTTTINGGVLDINSNATTTGNLAGTTNITLNSGGTLMLSNTGASSSTDRINDSATITMNGGIFKTGGLSEHGVTNNTAGIGALTLQSNSVLNLNNGSSIIAFANSSAQTWSGMLSIYNWAGSPSGGGTNQLYFGNDNTGLTAAQLADVIFYSDAGNTALGFAQILADGEIVPTAVPEPGTWVAGGLISVALLASARRRFSGSGPA